MTSNSKQQTSGVIHIVTESNFKSNEITNSTTASVKLQTRHIGSGAGRWHGGGR